MRVVVQNTITNERRVGYHGRAGFTVGRRRECEVSLAPSRFVHPNHFRVERGAEGWELEVLDRASPVHVDGQTVSAGTKAPLKPISEVRLAEFVLTLLQEEQETISERDAAIEDINAFQRELHTAVLRRLDMRRTDNQSLEPTEAQLEQINAIIDDLLHNAYRHRVMGETLTRTRLLGVVYENRLVAALVRAQVQTRDLAQVATPGHNPALEEAAEEFVGRLIRRMGLEPGRRAKPEDFHTLNARLKSYLGDLIAETPDNVQFYMIARFLKKVICDMIFGLGPLQDLLDTPAITEIMIVSPVQVYVEQAGRVVRSNRSFLSDEALMAVIERIVAPLGRRVDASQPLVDARLKDGSRVNAVIPPLALKGPCLTIRRFPTERIGAEDLVAWGSMTPAAHALLEAAVKARKNIIVSGGTGSGKTTLLNVLSSFIPEDERIVTIEDAAELQLDQEHVVSLETRPANVEGKGAYTIRDLVKNALRMRPDRIVVGECRGGEAVDMLQAMNTGHDGSLTTVHANSSGDVVSRLENMCLMAVEMPVAAIRQQVAQAVDLIVFIRRLKDGRRMITQVTEVLDVHPVTGVVEMRDILSAERPDDEPRLRPSGYLPSFVGDLVDRDLIDLARWLGPATVPEAAP